MADIFLSYARADQARVEKLAAALEKSGFSVWWDRNLEGGARFAKDIEQAMAEAQAVIAAWSPSSIESVWVLDEAGYGRDHGKLIPILLDPVEPPLGFRQHHALDLSQWKGNPSDRSFAALTQAIRKADREDAAPVENALAETPARKRSGLIVGGVIAAALIAGGAIYTVSQGGLDQIFEAEQAEKVGLAVMPFTYNGDQERAYLGSALASVISNGLSPLSGLTLIAGTSTNALAAQTLSASAIGEQLGVSHIVEGEITARENQLRMTVRLVDTADGQQIWSRSYDATPNTLETRQITVVRDLASALQSRLGVGRGNLDTTRSTNPRAYEAYLDGIENLFNRRDVNNRREAYRQFNAAIALDPDYAPALAGKAYLMAHSGPEVFSIDDEIWHREMSVAVDRALEIEPGLALARAAKVRIAASIDGDIEESLRLGRRLIEDRPDFGPAHYVMSSAYLMAGDYSNALAHIDQAIERDPFNEILQNARISALMKTGNYAAAAEEIRRCPGCEQGTTAWYYAAINHADRFEYENDREEIAARARKEDFPPEVIAGSQYIAHAIINGRDYDGPVPEGFGGYHGARLLAHLGFADEAFNQAAALRRDFPGSVIVDLLFDGRVNFTPEQRADPRYHALFDDGVPAALAAYRRNKGMMAGLPLAPAEIAAEKRRLAELDY